MNLTDVGRRARMRRKELKLTLQQVADKIGRTRGYVSRFESGKSGQDITDLGNIATALGMHLNDLIGEADEALVAEVRRQLPDGSDLVLNFQRIVLGLPDQAENERKFIRDSIQSLADTFGKGHEPAD